MGIGRSSGRAVPSTDGARHSARTTRSGRRARARRKASADPTDSARHAGCDIAHVQSPAATTGRAAAISSVAEGPGPPAPGRPGCVEVRLKWPEPQRPVDRRTTGRGSERAWLAERVLQGIDVHTPQAPSSSRSLESRRDRGVGTPSAPPEGPGCDGLDPGDGQETSPPSISTTRRIASSCSACSGFPTASSIRTRSPGEATHGRRPPPR